MLSLEDRKDEELDTKRRDPDELRTPRLRRTRGGRPRTPLGGGGTPTVVVFVAVVGRFQETREENVCVWLGGRRGAGQLLTSSTKPKPPQGGILHDMRMVLRHQRKGVLDREVA